MGDRATERAAALGRQWDEEHAAGVAATCSAFLALPAEALPSARDAHGDAEAHIAWAAVRGDADARAACPAVYLRADRDRWRDGVTLWFFG